MGRYKGELTIYRSNDVIIAIGEDGKQHNLGADDKNGVWVGLQLLKSEPVMKAAFFVGEEVGCIGSSKCDMTFFDDARFVIQCDRRNGSDLILNAGSVQLADSSFISQELRTKYGYKPTYGLMTDVQELKRKGLKVAACNLSCGYYNPHTEQEYTVVSELINCYRFVREIIATTGVTPHTYTAPKYPSYGHSQYSEEMGLFAGRYYNWEYYDDGWED